MPLTTIVCSSVSEDHRYFRKFQADKQHILARAIGFYRESSTAYSILLSVASVSA